MLVKPVTEQFGASISETDLSDISDSDFDEILAAWHKYAVLLFPKQGLTNEEHVEFTKRFGRLERGLKRKHKGGAGRIANVDKKGSVLPDDNMSKKFPLGNSAWHTDSSYKRVAAKASLLAAHAVPSRGGHTEWADMRQGYDVLDDDMKQWLKDKIAVHSYRFSHAWHHGLDILSDEELEDLPPVEHPIIQEHPDSGRKILFVGRHASHIVGQDFRESRKLLRELTMNAAQPPRTWQHKWAVGDIVIWDNRCVLHRARWTPEDEPRAMVRTTVAGDAPDNEWAN